MKGHGEKPQQLLRINAIKNILQRAVSPLPKIFSNFNAVLMVMLFLIRCVGDCHFEVVVGEQFMLG